MSTPIGLSEQMLCAYVALQHLQEGRPLIDIAEELELSRFKVGRMVRRARETGLIEVRLNMPEVIDTHLSRKVAQKFGLQSVIAVETSSDEPSQVRKDLARVGARVVRETVNEDDVIGLTSGRTIVDMCRVVGEFPNCEVVQLTGVATSTWNQGMQAILSLGVATNRIFPLHAPLVTTDAPAARAITAQPSIIRSLKRLDHISKAVLSIGGWPNSSLLATQLSEWNEMSQARSLGVVSELGTSLLTTNGAAVPHLTSRTIGISTEQLASVPHKIAIGGGHGKHDAVLAVLRSELVDVLITDIRTAEYACRLG
ncbi:sugar-binding transcriptional regulator [Nesterenkonia natronophila]|uniref:Sugar-binding domain-containing protein n=1 Tax=Nesterenkonia natronophila TaxID=2174932 RepID=A0A3A4G311_9MICC|nr:hypothetical protein D3250_01885 [Nesterenkonia natronophila]